MKRLVVVLMLAFAAAPVAVVRVATAEIKQRVVSGRVLNDAEAPVKDAVVYLKDTRTLAVKSYLSGEDGKYRFGQLSTTTDYEIWAESGPKKSKTKTISSFDTKSLFNIDLKL